MSKVFRASYSVLYLWSRGLHDEAIKTYLRIPRDTSPEMLEGKRLHEAWKKEIDRTKRLPQVFGGKKLKKPRTEHRIEVNLYDWLQITGIIDLVDQETVYEFKSGTSSSMDYARTMQASLYGALLVIKGENIKQVVFMHYNQYTGGSDSSYIWLTKERVEDSINWVITHAGEMYQYLEDEGIATSMYPDLRLDIDILPEEEV